MDLFKKCVEYDEPEKVKEQGCYPYFIPFSGGDDNVMEYNGDEKIMIGSNSYLGLTHHPRVVKAAKKATEEYGTGRTGSRFLNGTLDIHEEFEQELADFIGKEDALVFSAGYLVNLGVISSLLGRKDYLILDRLDHASIVDGSLLSRANILRYQHNDMQELEEKLQQVPEDAAAMIVVDGVFSMEGSIAKLPEISKLAKKYGHRLMVDDAHAIGVVGPQGRGTAAHFGITEEVDLVMGTFSKSFAAIGGFIAGDKDVVDYIKHQARPFIFTASLPPSVVASTREALKIIIEDDDRRKRLWEISKYMRENFQKLGFNTSVSETPVIPVIVGSNEKTFLLWKRLFDDGIYTNAVVSPAVPSNSARLRTSYIATHTDEQLDYVLEKFEKNGKELGII
ncbi:MAG: aminotransferase class I/II-fold pyridoxal phosphate-dependent enzyme [Candidatus Marinimicrobia bacterium]|nr:aminotransferase class I/II-fold pyridoxal phosphate-dependent enzyme [Candidatus Neomarinimicrobiota bacterium]